MAVKATSFLIWFLNMVDNTLAVIWIVISLIDATMEAYFFDFGN